MIRVSCLEQRNHEPTSPSRTTTDIRGKKLSKSEATVMEMWKCEWRKADNSGKRTIQDMSRYLAAILREEPRRRNAFRRRSQDWENVNHCLKESNKNKMSANHKQRNQNQYNTHHSMAHSEENEESHGIWNTKKPRSAITKNDGLVLKIHVRLPRSTREMLVVV